MQNSSKIFKLTFTAILAVIATVLMYLSFAIPLMPPFIKLDFSDFPALLASVTVGPIGGIAVSLIKNLFRMPASTTGGIGELSNFLLSCSFVVPAGFICRRNKSVKRATVSALFGAALMAAVSVFTNWFIIFPIYYNFMPEEAILGMYQLIRPSTKSIFEAIVTFNMPFTFVKGILNAVVAFLLFRLLNPLILTKFNNQK